MEGAASPAGGCQGIPVPWAHIPSGWSSPCAHLLCWVVSGKSCEVWGGEAGGQAWLGGVGLGCWEPFSYGNSSTWPCVGILEPSHGNAGTCLCVGMLGAIPMWGSWDPLLYGNAAAVPLRGFWDPFPCGDAGACVRILVPVPMEGFWHL